MSAKAITNVKMVLCVEDHPVPLEEVEANAGEHGIIKGHLVNLTTRGNYKWLEKALNQNHRFYRGNGCHNLEKFKLLKELQDEIKLKHQALKALDETKAPKFFQVEVRGRSVWVENCLKGVKLLLVQDSWDKCVEDIKWVVDNLHDDMNSGGFRAKQPLPESGVESSSDDSRETDTDSSKNLKDVFKTECASLARAATRHPKCLNVSYRPSRSSFMVKRREEDCHFDSQSTLEQQSPSSQSLSRGNSSISNLSCTSANREFFVKRPKGRKISQAKKSKLEPQGVDSSEETRQAFVDCLNMINAWLDGAAEPQEHPASPARASASQVQPLEPQVQPEGPQDQQQRSFSSDRGSENGHHMGQGPGPLGWPLAGSGVAPAMPEAL